MTVLFNEEEFIKTELTQVSATLSSFSVTHIPLITARKPRLQTKDALNILVSNMERFAWFTTRDKQHIK